MPHILATTVCAVLLILAALICGFARYNYFGANHNASLPYLNAVSTGVILAAAFTHILPDAMENLESFSYPLACASALCGFLLLVVVETVLTYQTLEDEHKVAAENHSRHDCSVHNHELGSSPVHSFLSKGIPSSVFPRVHQQGENTECYLKMRRANSFSEYSYGSLDVSPIKGTIEDRFGHDHSHGHQHGAHEGHDHSHGHDHLTHTPRIAHETVLIKPQIDTSQSHSHSHSHGAVISPDKTPKEIFAATYTFWMALVVHSTMEGFGIGVADTVIEQFTLVLAVLIHKVFESLALAGLLIDGKLPTHQAVWMYGIFVIATPIGAVLSAIIESYVASNGDDLSKLISGVITGMAAGSFM
jgi:zinc transporter ZupT